MGYILLCEIVLPQNAYAKKTDNILRFDIYTKFNDLNPAVVNGSGAMFVFPLLFSKLFRASDKIGLKPDIAVSCEYVPKLKLFKIYLRKNAKFHDNSIITAEDVEYSLNTIMAAHAPLIFRDIKKISVISKYCIHITISQDNPQFITCISDVEIIPKPTTKKKKERVRNPIGSGPFKLKKRVDESSLILEAFEDYHFGKPKLDELHYFYEPDKEKSWARLLSGETDVAVEISPKNYEITKKYEHKFMFNKYILYYYSVMLLNTFDPLFSDSNVRRALAYAIDRKYIVEKILKGYGEVSVGPLGVGSPYHNPKNEPLPYDPKQAVSLLSEVGWTLNEKDQLMYKLEKPFIFDLLVFSEYQIEKQVAQCIKLFLNEVGIRVNVRQIPQKELEKRYRKNTAFQAVLTEFNGFYNHTEYMQGLWTPSVNGCARAGCFDDPIVTDVLNKAIRETDFIKRKKMFYQFEKLMTALQPGIFLFQKSAIDVISKRFILKYPFSLNQEGIYQLWEAQIEND